MSFVTTEPEALMASAGNLQGIGAVMSTANGAVAAPTTGAVPAAADGSLQASYLGLGRRIEFGSGVGD